MPATAKCAEDLEQNLKISEASPKTPKSPRTQQQKGGKGSYAFAVANPAVVATQEQPKLISPAQLATAAPGELKQVLEGSPCRQKVCCVYILIMISRVSKSPCPNFEMNILPNK